MEACKDCSQERGPHTCVFPYWTLTLDRGVDFLPGIVGASRISMKLFCLRPCDSAAQLQRDAGTAGLSHPSHVPPGTGCLIVGLKMILCPFKFYLRGFEEKKAILG